ncbi:hypothetical protein MMC26_004947 [Xylographa opegraphella]|nr:hypothetical protein [Xylographa opegraphella]
MFHRFRRKRHGIPGVESRTAPIADSDPQQDSNHDTRQGRTLHHSPVIQSTISSSNIPVGNNLTIKAEARLKDRSQERCADPLGLHVIYESGSKATVNIIFVHGLGGSSHRSWSKDRDPALFWPEQWLPKEPVISDARIFSFGYNAAFQSTMGKENILNISDFAKDLLFSMKFMVGDGGHQLNLSQLPIIFIAHSMGGLVVKKAIILGQYDPHYKEFVQATRAVIFLSTPHRGTNLAKILNRILTVSVFGHSPKQYVSELKSNSLTLQEINEQFRSFAPSLAIVSFFETLETAVGPAKLMVLHKESSILGYPGEISQPLNADHHDVCKFASQSDPSYISVRNVLKYLVEQFQARDTEESSSNCVKERRKIESFISISSPPVDDYEFYLEKRSNGSCVWLLTDKTFAPWISNESKSSGVLWCKGRPGSGKSVLAAFVVQHLQESNHNCAFYFFRFGDQAKRTVSGFLRSVAYQLSCIVPEYRTRLLRMIDDSLTIPQADSKSIWQKLFISAFFNLAIVKPVYLVVDALDECEVPSLLLKFFADTQASIVPIRIIIISRDSQSLSKIFETALRSTEVTNLTIDDSREDLRLYIVDEIRSMRGDPGFKDRVAAEILDKADGNFLWVHLVIQEILQCHTQGAVAEALTGIPVDLEALYERMLAALEKNLRSEEQAMGRTILSWATCARRSLTLSELARALQPEYPRMIDLKFTVSQVCGEFVVVDNLSQISMIHSTAREYLTKSSTSRFGISMVAAHQHIFMKCLTVLAEPGLRSQVEQLASPSFLLYAATSWPYHLELTAASSDEASLILLAKFFRRSSVLTWIQILALTRQLRVLVHASKIINTFIENSNKLDADRSPLMHRLQEKELLALWATDLIRIVGKFGSHLVGHPKSIYRLVPSFCPRKSILFQQFGPKQFSAPMSISGTSNTTWDDCLAKFSVTDHNVPLGVVCLNQYFCIVMSDGVVILYHSSTYEEARRFSHGERVLTLCFSSDGEKLATYGFTTTKVWSVASAKQMHSFVNPSRAKALALTFKTGDDALIVFSDDRVVRCIFLNHADNKWETYQNILGKDTDGRQYNSPRYVSFSPDSDQVAVVFRGFPLSVWGVEEPRPRLIGRCERHGDKGERRGGSQSNYTDVQTMCWNPITKHVLGTYNDGCIFKWHPFETDYHESDILAVNIKCSPNGKFFVTSSVSGVLRIWDFQHFSIIYQLSCTSSITDLAIDIDGRRIYDLRDTFCSIWEPNVLLRLYETDEKASETTSTKDSSIMMSMTSESSAEMLEPVTAVSVNPRNLQYAVGNDEGCVRLFGVDGELIMELSQGFMTVEHIVWSDDGRLVAIADLSRRISIKSVNHEVATTPFQSVLVFKEEDIIEQIIFNSSADLLLVCTARFLNVWSLKTMASNLTWPQTFSGTIWATHPLNNALLLGFGFTSIHVSNWADLRMSKEVTIDRTAIDVESNKYPQESMRRRPSTPLPMSPSENEARVDKVWFACDGTEALVETSSAASHGRRKKQFMLIALTRLPIPGLPETESKVTPRLLPPDILARIEMPLGFISNDVRPDRRSSSVQKSDADSLPVTSENTLVFLDREYWICTWSFSNIGIGSRVRRHFFLPRDWLNLASLELALMRNDGTLMCPRNGEVALVWNGLKEEWIE